ADTPPPTPTPAAHPPTPARHPPPPPTTRTPRPQRARPASPPAPRPPADRPGECPRSRRAPGTDPVVLEPRVDRGHAGPGERRGQVVPIHLRDHVVHDGVADGEVGAHEVVQVQGPHVVVLLVEPPVGLLEARWLFRGDEPALLDDRRFRQATERIEV